MDLDKIHYFFQAARLENFTRAAKACHIAQTTMSKYISGLEQELGCTLFIRSHQRAELTAQGKLYYEEMKRITAQYQELCRKLQSGPAQELHIGMITSDYPDLPLLRSFEQENPEVSLYFSFASEKKLMEDLSCRRVDALICPDVLKLSGPLNHEEALRRENLLTTDAVLVCSSELLSRCGCLEKVISSQPLITKTEEPSYPAFCRRQLSRLFGSTFSQVIPVAGLSQQLLMVNLSNGFAIVPGIIPGIASGTDTETDPEAAPGTFSGSRRSLAVYPLPEEFRETTQLLYLGNPVSPLLQRLVSHIRQHRE